MGTFERLSVVVIGVILVMILVVAVATWQEDPAEPGTEDPKSEVDRIDRPEPPMPTPDPFPLPDPDPEPPLPEPAPEPSPDPAPAPEPTPGPAPAVARLHTVAAGESLGVIAGKYYPSSKYWKQLMRWNKLESERIAVGQELEIPSLEALGIGNLRKQGDVVQGDGNRPTPGGTWMVRKGQDLPTIAKLAYDNSARWPDIWIANRDKVQTPDELTEGMVLSLPR